MNPQLFQLGNKNEQKYICKIMKVLCMSCVLWLLGGSLSDSSSKNEISVII